MVKSIAVLFAGITAALLSVSFTEADTRSRVIIHTTMGDIKVVLYDETPGHRDNFLRIAANKTLDSTLFHRVIKNFMIQGGDIDSKAAKPGQTLGNGTLGYTLPAEIHPALFHKRGALAAARLGDDINPNRESSACQFYLVQGQVFTDSLLDLTIKTRCDQPVKQKIFSAYINDPRNKTTRDAFIRAQQRAKYLNKTDSLDLLSAQINPIIEEQFQKTPHRIFTPEQRKVYTTIGGTPHLDGSYTVFGEVESGLEIIEKISLLQTDGNARPAQDVRMWVEIVK
jgi:peptidylprolyl isomerase